MWHVRSLLARTAAVFSRKRLDREFADELNEHLALLMEENQARGLSAQEARRAALHKLGEPVALQEMHRELRGLPLLEALGRDVRYAARTLGGSPWFTVLTVLSLGLGIGANTALFSVADALLVRTLPVAEPERLVFVQRTALTTDKKAGIDRATFEALRAVRSVVTGAALHVPLVQPGLTIAGEAETGRLVVWTTEDFFRLLGVPASIGSTYRSTSENGQPVAVISDRFWRARFGRSTAVTGRTIEVNERSYAIMGVADPDFHGLSLDASVDVWLLSPPPDFTVSMLIARLQPNVTLEQAQSALSAAFAHLRPDLPVSQTQTEVVSASRGLSALRDQYRRPVLALVVVTVLVLLITCTNVGNLLAIRNAKRAQELSVRASLGASRTRLFQQLLVESTLLAAAGALAAWLIARWGVSTLLATLPVSAIPEQLEFHTDARVLLFMGALSLLGALLFGLAPAWRAARADVGATLKTLQHTVTPRRRGLWLVTTQVCLSIILLTGAGLFYQTLRNMTRVDIGFDTERLLQIELADRALRTRPEEANGLYRRLLDAVAAVPGVESVSGFGNPLFPPWWAGVPQPDDYGAGIVGPRFFENLGIELVRGRLFTPDDETRAEAVSIVSESYAREYFPGEEAIGKRAGYNSLEVVGVVKDINVDNVRWKNLPVVYRQGIREQRFVLAALLVRTTVEPATVSAPIAEAVSSVNPRLFVSARTIDEVINRSIARERLVALTSSFFGLLGLVLSGIGVFGVAAYTVARRTSELGLRIALGASRRAVIQESLRDTMFVVGSGLVAGLAGAFAGARLVGGFVSDLLFGLEASDLRNLTSAGLLMVLVAVAACLAPAIRALRIDPVRAIRTD
jgi:predicted permease